MNIIYLLAKFKDLERNSFSKVRKMIDIIDFN